MANLNLDYCKGLSSFRFCLVMKLLHSLPLVIAALHFLRSVLLVKAQCGPLVTSVPYPNPCIGFPEGSILLTGKDPASGACCSIVEGDAPDFRDVQLQREHLCVL
jgi:hypothetical protein